MRALGRLREPAYTEAQRCTLHSRSPYVKVIQTQLALTHSGGGEMWKEVLALFASVTNEQMDVFYKHCILSVLK
jgi:hypothetical protein